MSTTKKNGPAPTPTALRTLRGNPGKRAYPQNEPTITTADEAFDAVPRELASDPVAASEWTRLAPLLRRARIVTDGDRRSLSAACQQWSVYLSALENAPADRRVIITHNKYPMVNPYLTVANKALTQCIRLWDSLGLTPASRTRITTAPPPSESADPFAEFDEALPPRAREGPTLDTRRPAATDDDDEPRPH